MSNRKLFILITFIWSYIFWLTAIYLSYTQALPIIPNEVIILDILKGTVQLEQTQIIITSLSLIAAFGPMVGAITIYLRDSKARDTFRKLFNFNFGYKNLLEVILIILTIGVLPSVIIGLANTQFNLSLSIGMLILFGILFLIFQLLTSATEEIGWRGYLLPEYLEEGMSMWKASLRIGLIWAVWHYPIFIYAYWQQSLPIFVILLTLIGFTVGTVAMSVIHTYYLVKSKSVVLSMIIHATYNALPLTVGLLVTNSFTAALITQLGLWVVIWIIEQREGEIFDQQVALVDHT